jgi:hypothetical protein
MDAAGELPDTPLAHWFRVSGFTKRGLAQAVTEHARSHGCPQVLPDASRVRGWLRGERPREPVPGFLAAVLSERCAQPLTAADLGLGGKTDDSLTRYRGPADVLRDLGDAAAADLERGPRRAREAHDGPDPEPAQAALDAWAYAPPRPLPGTGGVDGRRLGAADADRIADYTGVFRRLDNEHGGGSTLHSATGQLAWAVSMIREGSYTDAAGRRLFGALADLAGCVGWMSHDTGRRDAALRYLTLAVHAARESGDRGLTAHLLQCQARVWGYLSRPGIAADGIALALYGARRQVHPVQRAGLHALAARFAALQGDAEESLREIRLAQEIYASGSGDPLPAYASYLDQAELWSTLGEVRLFLARATDSPGHANAAVGLLTAAAAGRPRRRVRSRAFDAAAAARAHLIVGDLDAAAAAGQQAAEIGARVDSARVAGSLARLCREAEPHSSDPAIRALREALSSAVRE